MAGPQMMGLEYAGATLCGFSVLDGRLVPMSVDGTVLGASVTALFVIYVTARLITWAM